MLEFEVLEGVQLGGRLSEIAKLRIAVFREFPYLYSGSEAYEEAYLRRYVEAPGSAVVLALHEGAVVGCSTCIPLSAEPEAVSGGFPRAGYPIEQVFYFGESILLPQFRGLGAGVEFFRRREAHALSFPGVRYTAFCAVVRPADHPRRPPSYVPLDAFWRKRGYVPVPGLLAQMSWQEVGEEVESEHDLQFWIKDYGEGRSSSEISA